MDTSETYIKMCEKATEIQVLRDRTMFGNWNELQYLCQQHRIFLSNQTWYSERDKSWYRYKCYECAPGHIVDFNKCIWLPRQDQLQEMVCGRSDLDHSLERFDDFIRRYWDYLEGKTPIGFFDSMEQLWLAFTQYDLFCKVWNGKDWIAVLNA